MLELLRERTALDVLVAILGVLWLGSAVSIARLLREERDARREVLALAAWALAMTAWRSNLPAHFFASVSADFPDRTTKIGLGWPTLTAALSRVAPRTDWVSFGAARVCGVLTGPLAYAALRRLSPDRRVALLGAALLVALPFHIALATGDDAHPAALMLFLAGLSHFADYANHGRRVSFALAAPCLLLMVHTRFETGFLPLSILALVVRPREFAGLVRRDTTMLTLVGAAAVSLTLAASPTDLERCLPYPTLIEVLREALRAVALFPTVGGRLTMNVTVLGRATDLSATQFDEVSWAPVVLLPLLWVGWGQMRPRRRLWRMLAAVLLARLPAYVSLNVDGADYLGARHFVGVLPLLCLVAATGAVAVGDKLGRAAPLAAVCVAALFVAEASVPLRFRFAYQEEYVFLRRSLATLPKNAEVSNLQFEFGLSPSESSLRLLRPDLLWVDFGRDDAPLTRFAYLGPDCRALQSTDLRDATRVYLDSGERLARLQHMRERCERFEHLPTRRALASGSVSRHGHGPPPEEGPRLPTRLVEFAPTRTDVAAGARFPAACCGSASSVVVAGRPL